MQRVGQFFARDVLSPPFRYLPLVVFIYAVVCFIFHPNGAIRTGYLADTDDYMRLNEVINWLQGQGWHDLSHPRLSPGSHTVVHWSRLLDIPIAILMLPILPFKGIGIQGAALFASFLVPPATFAVLLWLVTELAKPLVGEENGNLAAPLVLFAPLTMINFVPGRVDHHGYEVLVAGFALLALQRLAESPHRIRYPVSIAVTLACGLWIGTEALPWVLLFVGCLSVAAAWQGGELLWRSVLFGLAFLAATSVVLHLAVPSEQFTSLALSWYSAADVVLAGLVACVLVGVWLVGKLVDNRWLRFTALGIFAFVAAVVFCAMVPEIWNGPFADYDRFDATVALDGIGEAQPFIKHLKLSSYNYLEDVSSLLGVSQTILLPFIGFLAILFAFYRADPKRRIIVFPYVVFLTASILLTVFWQIRVGWFMQFLAVPPLTYLLVTCWQKAEQNYSGRSRYGLEVLALLSLGFIPIVLIPALVNDAPFTSSVVLFPAARPPEVCPLRPATDFLSAPWAYGSEVHTIMSSGNEGPELLFRTRHNVIAANFNVAGNEDAYNFFGAHDDAEAKKIVKHWHADLVLLCRSFPLSYARLSHARIGKTAFLSLAGDGNLHLMSNPEHPTLIERLARGPIPDWLKPVEIPGDKDYLLFEVHL